MAAPLLCIHIPEVITQHSDMPLVAVTLGTCLLQRGQEAGSQTGHSGPWQHQLAIFLEGIGSDILYVPHYS